ncbi:MAG: ABC transporter ATP-binding protein [Chitinophagales bacterium]
MLEVSNLSVYHGKARTVDGLSFRVKEGQIVGILGANGAGKTTTLSAISGMAKIGQGSVIKLAGENLVGLSPERIVRKGIAHVPEGRKVFPGLTVVQNLQMGAYTRKDRDGVRADLEEMYRLFPILKERQNQTAGTLSGGEQQMLAIARGLMGRPKLLLLDEPSLGLAPIIVDRIFERLEEIRRKGVTILLVEQNARRALTACDYLFVITLGRVVLEGAGQDLMRDESAVLNLLGGGATA